MFHRKLIITIEKNISLTHNNHLSKSIKLKIRSFIYDLDQARLLKNKTQIIKPGFGYQS